MSSNGHDAAPQANSTTDDSRQELTAQIDDLLNTLSNKFSGVSSEIFAKMDEMSRRLDSLESQLKSKDDGASTTSGI